LKKRRVRASREGRVCAILYEKKKRCPCFVAWKGRWVRERDRLGTEEERGLVASKQVTRKRGKGEAGLLPYPNKRFYRLESLKKMLSRRSPPVTDLGNQRKGKVEEMETLGKEAAKFISGKKVFRKFWEESIGKEGLC